MRQQKAPPPTAAGHRYPPPEPDLPAGGTLFVDASRGVAGDMLLAALLDLGIPQGSVFDPLARSLPPFEASYSHENRRGLTAARLEIRSCEQSAPRRGLRQISELIEVCAIPDAVKSQALQVFGEIAQVEGAIHGQPVDEIHFHEVGALDSLVDTIGVLLAVHILGVDRVISSPIALGSGVVRTAHGLYPVPAPATLALCEGLPTTPLPAPREVSTPTGVALLRVLCETFGVMPAGVVRAVGYGAGRRIAEPELPPNVLRCVHLQSTPAGVGGKDRISVLETNVDTVTGEDLGNLIETLLDQGALDAFVIPTMQKKSRPGYLLCALVESERRAEFGDLIFAETGTLGIRWRETERRTLRREWRQVEVLGQTIRVKRAQLPDGSWVERPEYEDLAGAMRATGVSMRELRSRILAASSTLSGGAGAPHE